MIDEDYQPSCTFEAYMKNALLKKGTDGLPQPQSRMEVLLWELCVLISEGSSGQAGSNGKSAYELAVESGYQGTLEEWLASLVGPQGAAGKDGRTVELIKTSDSIKWRWTGQADGVGWTLLVPLSDIKGADGKDGINGSNGADGADGYTPVRGVDYWTESDVNEIKAYIDAKIAEAVNPGTTE